MDKLVIEGGKALYGSLEISGSKNACLPIMAAALLTDDECVIKNAPALKDVHTLIKILNSMGREVKKEGDTIIIKRGRVTNLVASYDLVSTMRASIVVLGALLGRYGKAKVSFPGGCVIGPRPIDLHLKGIRALGTDLKIEEGYIIAKCARLKGARIYLGGHFGSSVLATANTLMAATLADGETIIANAAGEPEVEDLANFLISMGARIKGAGTPTIVVEGVKKLSGTTYKIIPDRIEAGTYMIAAIMTRGKLFIKDAVYRHNIALIDKLKETGACIDEKKGGIEVKIAAKNIKSVDITTLTYPGFPTDLQAQIMSLTTVAEGISVITEKVYPERFIHISELNRMGAQIILEGSSAIIKGVKKLSGAPVMASDLRASAGLVLAGLVAKGRTEVSRLYHIDRGYEKIEEKLTSIGAKAWRIQE